MEYGRAFRSLPSLRLLHLRDVFGLSLLLGAAIHCASLERLLVQAGPLSRGALPAAAAVAPLLSLPKLRRVYLGPDPQAAGGAKAGRELAKAYAHLARVEIVASTPFEFLF